MTFEHARMGEFLKTYEMERYKSGDLYSVQSIIVSPDAEELGDVSFYQKGMKWDVYKQKHRAAIIRIGQNVWQDPEFDTNYTQAKANGIALGGYFFFDGRATPAQQADVIVKAMAGKSFELELYIDFERNYGGQYEGLANAVKLMQLVEQAGVKCKAVGMYTGYYYFLDNHTTTSFDVYLRQRPLWLAWYASPTVVKVPAPWTEWNLWQWGTPVINVGQPTAEIDMNKSRYSRSEFETYYLGGATTPPTGGSMDKYTVVGPYGLNLRPAPSRNNTPILLSATGTLIWGVLDASGYVKGSYYQQPGEQYATRLDFYCAGDSYYVRKETTYSDPPLPPVDIASVFVTHAFHDTLTINGATYEADFSIDNVEYKPKS